MGIDGGIPTNRESKQIIALPKAGWDRGNVTSRHFGRLEEENMGLSGGTTQNSNVRDTGVCFKKVESSNNHGNFSDCNVMGTKDTNVFGPINGKAHFENFSST